MKRVLHCASLHRRAAIYGLAVERRRAAVRDGARSPTGATHNDCGELKQEIADRDYGGDEDDGAAGAAQEARRSPASTSTS